MSGGEQKALVGYKRPPAEHQFKKGASGNPKGRPRKRRRANDPVMDVGAQPANAILMQEAYRLVTIREGDKVEQLPAIQAVFRAMGVSAMKGNRFAQRMLADLVRGVEDADRKSRLDYLKTMITYKVEWERAIEGAHARGIEPPRPLPHPDDIIINLQTGDAKICGPATREDKEKWDRLLEYRDEMQIEVSEFAGHHARARSADKKEFYLKHWILGQKCFDRINDNLPKRYRKNLEDRCWKAGASRPGSLKRADWPE